MKSPMWPTLAAPQKEVILNLRNFGPCTREQLGQRLSWTPSSLSKIVSPLLEQKVLTSDPPGARRRNAQLSTAAVLGHAIGVELGFEQVRAAMVDSNGKIIG